MVGSAPGDAAEPGEGQRAGTKSDTTNHAKDLVKMFCSFLEYATFELM